MKKIEVTHSLHADGDYLLVNSVLRYEACYCLGLGDLFELPEVRKRNKVALGHVIYGEIEDRLLDILHKVNQIKGVPHPNTSDRDEVAECVEEISKLINDIKSTYNDEVDQ